MTTRTTTTNVKTGTTKLMLRTAYGPEYRDVLNTPPRDCTASEIPTIDLTQLYSPNLEDRKALALKIRYAGVNTGFFYIKNHGIPEETIANAKKQLLTFFKQSPEDKAKVSREKSKYFNGWRGAGQTNIDPAASPDVNESLGWKYHPKYDPDPKEASSIPAEVLPWIRGEEFVWEGTSHLPNFKTDVLAYWSACLTLSRRLVRIFALALDLNEHYFDDKTTFPGADGVFNYYPVRTKQEAERNDVGLGSHTDLQLFTLLWQDMIGGLQVLNKEGQWIKALPQPGTIVVNIGDFMMRISNDTFKSTVHRVYNTSMEERVSMPFFFGLNFNEVCGVVPTCVSEKRPAKYKPISCGDWCQLRFALEAKEARAKGLLEDRKDQAPSGLVVDA